MKDAKDWRVWSWAYAPVAFWVIVIFFLSSPSGSKQETSMIIGPILHLLFPNISPATELVIHNLVRKAAHLTEYAVLALLAIRGLLLTRHVRGVLTYFLPCILVALVASADEFNQSFEPSRTSSVWDVLIDIAGGVLAAVIVALLLKRRAGRRSIVQQPS